MKDKDYTEYFDCECACSEHVLRFIYMGAYKDIEPPQLYLDLFLYHYHNFFQRIWIAIKYIFGYKCKYGHFDNWIIDVKDAQRFRDMVNRYEKETEEFKKTQEAG